MTRKPSEMIARRVPVACALAWLTLSAPAFAEAPPTAAPTPPAARLSVDECIEHHRLAQVERRRGHLLASGNELRSCLSPECSPVLREACAALLTEVTEDTPSVVFITESGNRDLAAITVYDGDTELTTTLDGSALALDPGEHHFRFEAPGMAVASLVVMLRAGDHRHSVTVSLVPAARSTPPVPAPAPPAPSLPPPLAAGAPLPSHTWDYALLGTGAALGIAGAVFGLSARSDYRDAEATCSPFCSESRQARIRRKDFAADSLFVLSIAATTYGAIRLFTVGRGREKTTLNMGLGTLVAEGKF